MTDKSNVPPNGDDRQAGNLAFLHDAPQKPWESKEEYFKRQHAKFRTRTAFEKDQHILSRPELNRSALHGVLKDIVEAACENTEAVPSSVAMHVLARFAATIGRTAYIQIGDQKRHLQFDALIVGPTARGRKGTSADMPRQLFHLAEYLNGPLTLQLRELGALSTGEGLIHQVRDPIYKDGKCIDSGVDDKRLLCNISEFAGVLSVAKRETQTITMVLRDAFDGMTLTTPTKTSFNRATDAHIVVLGSVPETELAKHLTQNDMTNGLANRFGMFYSSREKIIASPTATPPDLMRELAERIRPALLKAMYCGEIVMDAEATELWTVIYADLNMTTHPELIGKLLARQDLYTRIFAALLALVNGDTVVTCNHLMAALAWMHYWEDTVQFVFSTSEKNAEAQVMREVMNAIVTAITTLGGRNISHTDIAKKLTSNYSVEFPAAKDIKDAIELLQRESPPRICVETVTTGGRPSSRYSLVRL